MQYNDLMITTIGKNGLTNEAIANLRTLLEQHRLIKVKFLDKEKMDTSKLPGKIEKQIGKTVVLKRNWTIRKN